MQFLLYNALKPTLLQNSHFSRLHGKNRTLLSHKVYHPWRTVRISEDHLFLQSSFYCRRKAAKGGTFPAIATLWPKYYVKSKWKFSENVIYKECYHKSRAPKCGEKKGSNTQNWELKMEKRYTSEERREVLKLPEEIGAAAVAHRPEINVLYDW